MIEQTNTATDSVVADPIAPVAPIVKGRFDEQIALLPDSMSAPVLKQLELMDLSTVHSIVENHDGSVSILYKTYADAKEANIRQDSLANSTGSQIVSKAKAKLGSEYYTGTGTETETFSMGKLVEFQATGLIIVMVVIVGLCVLTYLMAFIIKKLGLSEEVPKKVVTPVAPLAPPPATSSLDPSAPSAHPGFTNGQLQAFLSMAAVAALDIHPGLSNEELAIIFAIAAAEILGEPCAVVRFKSSNSSAWTSVVQNRIPSI